MPRTFAKIEPELLKQKILDALSKHEDIEPQQAVFDKDFHYKALRCMSTLTPTIQKDLKVKFDLENVMGAHDGPNKNFDPPHGFYAFNNGFVFYAMSAGGDWEYPVYFIIYWDGAKLRAYVPTEGNPWNTDTKEAYGNDSEGDEANFRKRYPTEPFDNYSDTVTESVGWDRDAILADIRERIQPK